MKWKALENRDEFDFYLDQLRKWKPPMFNDPDYGKCYRGDFLLIEEFIQRLRHTKVHVHNRIADKS